MERYYVSYNMQHQDGLRTQQAFGGVEVTLNKKITSYDVVKEIIKQVEAQNDYPTGSVVILSFQRFDK